MADNERKNVNFPTGPIIKNLQKGYYLNAFLFHKIDPSKDGWGDITVDIEVKEPKMRQIDTQNFRRNQPPAIEMRNLGNDDDLYEETGINIEPIGGTENDWDEIDGTTDPTS